MTNAMHTCYLCRTAEATAMKTEVDTEWLEDDTEVQVPTTRPICLPCNDRWFDGTEECPELLPLS
jgi:hypothetical protein